MSSGLILPPREQVFLMLLGVLSIGAAYPDIVQTTFGYGLRIGAAPEEYRKVGYGRESAARRLWSVKDFSL